MPRPSTIAAVRGANSVRSNTPAAIQQASAELLRALIERNALTPELVVSAVFTATPDLSADFPAHAARRLGWTDVPLLGAVEMAVPGAPPRIVRVLLTVRVAEGARLSPVYLGEARKLRPDLSATSASPAPRRRGAASRSAPPIVAIVGLGQIGGSIALALRRAGGWRTVGWDADPRVRRRARAIGLVDALAPSLAAACGGAALAVAATPVDRLPAVIAACAAALPRGAALIDTGSTRRGVTSALRAARRRGIAAVGGHPLAGNERRGLAGADGRLFERRAFLLLPLAGSPPAVVRRFVRALGARPLVAGAAEHDRALARTSHLPYVLSRALALTGGAAAARGLAGPGFAGMTRLAASDPRVARAYVRANRANVRRAWSALRRRVDLELRRVDRG